MALVYFRGCCWDLRIQCVVEVAIHTILYVRQIYPPDLFVRRKKYDTPVFQSRHPALNEYISGAVKAVGDEMAQGTVEKVVVVIKNKQQVVMERFIFSVENMIQVESFNKEANLRSVEGAMTALSLTQYFRSFLIKLGMIESHLGQMNLGDDVSFAILLELRDTAAPSVSQSKASNLPPL
uniref:Putative spindle checkpoint protein n=1 Tax=Coprinellus disseminatus TaxID=71703 RepID=Q1WMR6_COPDI|nr:putative spindle checkpoint protein [Coprinellus disseminatus]